MKDLFTHPFVCFVCYVIFGKVDHKLSNVLTKDVNISCKLFCFRSGEIVRINLSVLTD